MPVLSRSLNAGRSGFIKTSLGQAARPTTAPRKRLNRRLRNDLHTRPRHSWTSPPEDLRTSPNGSRRPQGQDPECRRRARTRPRPREGPRPRDARPTDTRATSPAKPLAKSHPVRAKTPFHGFSIQPDRPDPQSQSFSQSYGSILPTSLTYIVLSARGCSPRRPAADMGTIWRENFIRPFAILPL